VDSWLVAAALASALLHASWHAVVKSSPHTGEAMTAQMVGSALLALPALAIAGLPTLDSVPWMIGSTLLSIGAVSALLRGYARGGFGVVYPITRASSVLLVLPLAAAIAGEWPAPRALAGVALVSAAVLMLAFTTRAGGVGALTRPALGWTLLAATCTAGYIVCDAQGVRKSGSALSYGFAVGVTNGVLWGWLQHRGGMRLGAIAARMWPKALALALAATVSYLLILWVWMHAPIALGSALRDTSAIFATLIALVILKEPFDWRVVLAVALATAGSILIRLG
jgi:drug/metabolite transporter (DMT)-like permease